MRPVELLPSGQRKQLERYQLIGELASGGMATVYLARLAGVGGFSRFVAIKRLHPHLASEQTFVEMFLDEARIAAGIHHQNVVPILEIGTSVDGYYLVMEYVEGVTVARLMAQSVVRKEPVPRPILLRLIIDTLSGLHAAHELSDESGELVGLVHRDCSPQNILVGVDGCTRITDFGIARARARIANTREGEMKGKLAYMAPEQTQGEEIDRRADLFSVGVVLWEVLTARRLFKSTTEAATLRRLLVTKIPAPSEMCEVHGEIDAVVMRALERNPDDRFQTAAEMADAVEVAARRAHGLTTAQSDDRLSGDEPIATVRTVEAYMKRVYYTDVSQQREAVREWLAVTPSGVIAVPSSPGSTAGAHPAPESMPFPPASAPLSSIASPSSRPRADQAPESVPVPSARALLRASDPVLSSSCSSPSSSTVPSRPSSGESGSGDEDATRIYESSSTTAVTSELGGGPELAGSLPVEPLPVRRRGWLALLAAVAVLGVAGYSVMSSDSRTAMPGASSAPIQTPPPVQDGTNSVRGATEAAPATPQAPTATQAAVVGRSATRAVPAPATASAIPWPARSVPRRTDTTLPDGPDPPPATTGTADLPEPSPPASGPDEDLSNPYR